MSCSRGSDDWESGAWLGARRAHIRAYLKLTVRERLEAVAEMARAADVLRNVAAKPYGAGQSAAAESSRAE